MIKPYPPYGLLKLRKNKINQGHTTFVLCFGTVHSNKKKERKPRYDPGHNHGLKNQGVTLVLWFYQIIKGTMHLTSGHRPIPKVDRIVQRQTPALMIRKQTGTTPKAWDRRDQDAT